MDHEIKVMARWIAILLISASMGCNVQRGRFVVSGDEGFSFATPGGLVVVKGALAEPLTGRVSGTTQNLLYVLFISTEFPRKDTSGVVFGEFSTTLVHTLNDGTRDIQVSLEWDRKSDKISVTNLKFSRATGNVFVVRLDAKGNVVCRQLGNLGPNGPAQEALELARQKLPNDGLVSKLMFK